MRAELVYFVLEDAAENGLLDLSIYFVLLLKNLSYLFVISLPQTLVLEVVDEVDGRQGFGHFFKEVLTDNNVIGIFFVPFHLPDGNLEFSDQGGRFHFHNFKGTNFGKISLVLFIDRPNLLQHLKFNQQR